MCRVLLFMKRGLKLRTKTKYKIPYTLDPKFGDVRTSLKMEDGKGIDKEFTVRGILISILAGAIWIWLVFSSQWSTFFQEGSLIGNIIFSIGYFGLFYFGLREISIPGLYGYNVIGPLFRYLKMIKHRDVPTKSFSSYKNASIFTGMIEPDKQGRLRFVEDGTYGMLFRISGTASNNTFSVDREQAIDSFESFLRTLPHKTTYAFITNTGGQKVDRQLKHLFDQFDTETDQNMLDYIAEQIRELGGYVQKNFVALHQYVLIQGDDLDALENAVKLTRMFIEQGQLAITELAKPTPKDITNIISFFYSGLSNSVNERYKKFVAADHNQESELSTAGSLTATHKPRKIHVKSSITTKPKRIKVHVKGTK